MKIIDIKVMRGPNYWSNYRQKLVVMKLDLEDTEDYPTNKIDGFAERLEELMPSLYSHRCSKKEPGGFFQRVREGNITYKLLDNESLIMLGYGINQKIIRATMACTTSSVGVEIASNKEETKRLLANSFVPVPLGKVIKTESELEQVIEEIGFPL